VLSVSEQCELLGLSRSSYYYEPATESVENLALMALLDKEYTDHPFRGSRGMRSWLRQNGHKVNRKRVQRLMRLHKVYPYLLRGVEVERADQVWSTDITYIPMPNGFMYLTAVIDWYSRYVLSWKLSNTLDTSFCLEALQEALSRGCPEVFNTDQGVQFTSASFTSRVEAAGAKVSMDGRGRCLDNVFVERLWRTVKYEYVYLWRPEAVPVLAAGLKTYFRFYNEVRLHSAVGYVTPKDRLLGNDDAIHAERDRKLAEARERRKQLRQTRHEQLEAQPDASRPAIDFAAVRAAITIAQVLALLGFTPRSDHAGQQRGPCPLHGSTRCFSVNTNSHTFHCFKCNRSGNALDLWAEANRLSIYDAAIDLCQRLNVPLPTLPPPATANREEESVATGSSTCTIP
jgi:putative transposase